MYIALSDKLLEEFFEFKKGNIRDKELLQKLFGYIQPFSISRNQLENLDLDIAIKSKIISGGDIITPVNATTEKQLINSTLYKIMLTDNKNHYPYVNILLDKIEINYTATYKKDENRDKAKEHIKNLLSKESQIDIIDRYLSPQSNRQWNKIFELLKYILPDRDIRLNIYFDNSISSRDIKNILEDYNHKWSVNLNNYDNSIHDRYIESEKVKILLSSGFLNLANTEKDFTYIIKAKKD